jgi:hypothetical protein
MKHIEGSNRKSLDLAKVMKKERLQQSGLNNNWLGNHQVEKHTM